MKAVILLSAGLPLAWATPQFGGASFGLGFGNPRGGTGSGQGNTIGFGGDFRPGNNGGNGGTTITFGGNGGNNGNQGGFGNTGSDDPCEACPATFCMQPNDICDCLDQAALQCYRASGGQCRIPQIPSCQGNVPSSPTRRPTSTRRPTTTTRPTTRTTRTTYTPEPTEDPEDPGEWWTSIYTPQPTTPTTTTTTTKSKSTTTKKTSTTVASPLPSGIPEQPVYKTCRGLGFDADCSPPNTLCIPDPNALANAPSSGICVNVSQQCGGTGETPCQSGYICVDDPRDGCGLGGVGCLGICI